MATATILVVEDEFITAADLQNNLREMGYDVPVVVDTGEGAIKKAGELHPDLVLMDITLIGEMTGIEAAAQIRDRYGIPVIFLTAHSDDPTFEKALHSEPFGYIIKPIEPLNLRTSIGMALYKHALDKKLKKINEELEQRVRERTGSLDQQVQFLQQLIDTIPAPVYYKDTRGVYIGCNNAFEAYAGISKRGIIKKTDSDVFSPDFAALSSQKDSFLFSRHGIQVYQAKFVHSDQSVRDVIFKKATFNDTGGNLAGIIGVMLDITDRIRAEQALRESEERLRAVVQDQTELIYRYRHDRTVLFANRAFLQYFRKTAQDTIGYIFQIRIHPDDDARVQEHFRSLTPDRPVASIEYRVIMPDGTVRSQQWINRAFFDDHGRITEYQSVGRDTTERKETGEREKEI
jgi:PAS domain S-box-containing protein